MNLVILGLQNLMALRALSLSLAALVERSSKLWWSAAGDGCESWFAKGKCTRQRLPADTKDSRLIMMAC
jgi:hypothetical protein